MYVAKARALAEKAGFDPAKVEEFFRLRGRGAPNPLPPGDVEENLDILVAYVQALAIQEIEGGDEELRARVSGQVERARQKLLLRESWQRYRKAVNRAGALDSDEVHRSPGG